MARTEPMASEAQGYKLVCPVCRHDLVRTRRSLLNTAAMTFFNLDWANRESNTFIRERCGHILWFQRG